MNGLGTNSAGLESQPRAGRAEVDVIRKYLFQLLVTWGLTLNWSKRLEVWLALAFHWSFNLIGQNRDCSRLGLCPCCIMNVVVIFLFQREVCVLLFALFFAGCKINCSLGTKKFIFRDGLVLQLVGVGHNWVITRLCLLYSLMRKTSICLLGSFFLVSPKGHLELNLFLLSHFLSWEHTQRSLILYCMWK